MTLASSSLEALNRCRRKPRASTCRDADRCAHPKTLPCAHAGVPEKTHHPGAQGLSPPSTRRDRANGRGGHGCAGYRLIENLLICVAVTRRSPLRVAGAGAQGTKGVLRRRRRSRNLERSIRPAWSRRSSSRLRISEVLRCRVRPASTWCAPAPLAGAITPRISGMQRWWRWSAGVAKSCICAAGFRSTGLGGSARDVCGDLTGPSWSCRPQPARATSPVRFPRALSLTAILPLAAGLACLVEDEAEQGRWSSISGLGTSAALSGWRPDPLETLPWGPRAPRTSLRGWEHFCGGRADEDPAWRGGSLRQGALEMIEAPVGAGGRLEATSVPGPISPRSCPGSRKSSN
jgi:hypothetical protein